MNHAETTGATRTRTFTSGEKRSDINNPNIQGAAKRRLIPRAFVSGAAGLLLLSLGTLSGCSEPDSQQAQQQPLEGEALIAEGRKKARVCTGCHGPNGISRIPQNPSLAGLPQEYLEQQLRAFRSGERENATMSSIAMNLSDQDINAVSHYFASLPGPAEN